MLPLVHFARRRILLAARPALKLYHPFVVRTVRRFVSVTMSVLVVGWVRKAGVRPPLAAVVVVWLAVVAWVTDLWPLV